MKHTRSIEERISLWMEEEGTAQFPDRVLGATFDQTRQLHQAGSSRWRTIPMFRSFGSLAAVGAAAVVIVVAGAVGLNFFVNHQPGIGTASPSPSAATASPEPTSSPPTSGGMWPQTSLDEVRQAQERADAGDPDYTWQLDPQLAVDIPHSFDSEDSAFITRFLREVLGWEKSIFNSHVGWDELYSNLVFVRCTPDATNALYPTDEHAGRCASTLDEQRYETVRLDLGQPAREGPDGIWVVTRWTMTPPFAQTDPAVAEAQATARLQEFLQARVDGEDAEGYVDVIAYEEPGMTEEVPLLYETTAGSPYERFEIERVSGPWWPFAGMGFEVRLLADGGETVVAQQISWDGRDFTHRATETTENGEPVAARYVFFDGLVSMSAALPWDIALERPGLDLSDEFWESIVVVADPRAVEDGCSSNPSAATAADLAASLQANPDLEVTALAEVTVGGSAALQMDIVMAPGAGDCGEWQPVLRQLDNSDRRGANLDPGTRMRLYLLDVPDGTKSRVVAIAVTAPEARFDAVLGAATPVLESVTLEAP